MKAPCVHNYPVFSKDPLHTAVSFNHIVAVVNFNECFFQKKIFFKEAICVYWIWKKQKSVKEKNWSGLSFPSPGDLPDPWIEPISPALQVDSLCRAIRESHVIL